MLANSPPYDALFIGAHPDDVEIMAGGTVLRMTSSGRRVLIADCTQGEMGSRGSVEERREEAAAAAALLGADRTNLLQPDGRLAYEMESLTRAIITIIRAARPRFVFTHAHGDHHPDHNAVAVATKYAVFQSNLVKYETGQERFQIGRLFYYGNFRKGLSQKPDLLVDISEFYDQKQASLKAYKSQMANKEYEGPPTYLASDAAWRSMMIAAGSLGSMIDRPYAEGFFSHAPLWLDDLFSLQDAGI